MQYQAERNSNLEVNALISRSEMLDLAREYNLVVTKSTIHRWASKSDFPAAEGQYGKAILYSREQFIDFLRKRLRRVRDDY